MGIYGKASELVDTLQTAIARGEPIVDLAPQLMTTGLELMRQGSLLMDRVVRALDGLDTVSGAGSDVLQRLGSTLDRLDELAGSQRALLSAQEEVARLQAQKLALEIRQLEQG